MGRCLTYIGTEGLQLRDKRRPSDKQDVFTNEDLKLIFCESDEYGKDKHTRVANFWIPLLALYTGARLEELCQLLTKDVVNRDGHGTGDGIWCLDIREDNGERKSVKIGERRIVPLHPFLVDTLHFPEFVKKMADKKHERLFPELCYVNHRWGHGFGRWFGVFKERCGIQAPPKRKTFHSFRHTLINHLKQNEAEQQYVKEFVGHKSRGDITWDLYGKQFQPAKLMEKVAAKLDYPIDLSHLRSSKWVKG